MDEPKDICKGCGRPEIHKMCPAWGTRYYMSGILFTEEMEKECAGERTAAIEAARNNDGLDCLS